MGDIKTRYDEYISGCVDFYNKQKVPKGNRCKINEKDRIEMTLRQPQSCYNYTTTGYIKIRAPEHVFKLIKEFWDKNKGKETPENWAPANIYTNHWAARTYMLSVENNDLDGAGYDLKQHIWNAARDTIEEWTGQKQAECSLYGIRIYKEGAMLAPHVDRMPLVSSAIINVDQDVDEPWPLEVIGHDGVARNVTMEPGDLVLYESHSVIHGRQFPLKGRFMANIFIHFEPIGPIGGQVQTSGELPPYLIPGSPEEPNWRRSNPRGHRVKGYQGSFTTGSTELHHHALSGDFEKLKAALDKHGQEDVVNARDANGWTALHEAVREGTSIEAVQLLLDHGAEVNARTGKNENGQSPLVLAKQFHGQDHAVTKLLESRGAKEYDYEQEL